MNFLWNSVKRETMAGIFSSCGKMVHLKCHVPGTLQENNNLPIQSVYKLLPKRWKMLQKIKHKLTCPKPEPGTTTTPVALSKRLQ